MSEKEITKTDETRALFLTTAFIMPLITVTLIGVFGFLAWLSQSLLS